MALDRSAIYSEEFPVRYGDPDLAQAQPLEPVKPMATAVPSSALVVASPCGQLNRTI